MVVRVAVMMVEMFLLLSHSLLEWFKLREGDMETASVTS